MNDSKISAKKELKSTEELSLEASEHKTPKKAALKTLQLKSFILKSDYSELNDAASDFMIEIENHLNHIQETTNEFIKNLKANSDQLFTSMKVLEFKKNKLKSKIGNRD